MPCLLLSDTGRSITPRPRKSHRNNPAGTPPKTVNMIQSDKRTAPGVLLSSHPLYQECFPMSVKNHPLLSGRRLILHHQESFPFSSLAFPEAASFFFPLIRRYLTLLPQYTRLFLLPVFLRSLRHTAASDSLRRRSVFCQDPAGCFPRKSKKGRVI